MRALLHEPLLHFAVLAALLLALSELFNAETAGQQDSRVIQINPDALLTFIQYRTKTFHEGLAQKRLSSLSAEERVLLEQDYFEEEALYREALALGLDNNDYIIKQRLVQRMRFLAQGFSGQNVTLSEQQIQQFFNDHRADYFIAPSITFTHVFFDAQQRGWHQALAEAQQLLPTLRANTVPFEQAGNYGDRFHYHRNYIARTEAFINDHFGNTLSQQIFSEQQPINQWLGPLRSPLGVHLVLMTERTAGSDAVLEQVRSRVEEDAHRMVTKHALDKAIAELTANYRLKK